MFKKIIVLTMAGLLTASIVFADDPATNGGWSGDDDVALPGPAVKPGKVLRIQRSTSRADINTYVTKIYTLKNAHASEVAGHLAAIVSAESGRLEPNAGGKMTITVTVPEYQIPYIDKVIETLDVKEMAHGGDDVVTVYRCKNRNGADLRTTLLTAGHLDNIYGSGDGSIMTDTDLNALICATIPGKTSEKVREIIEKLDVAPPQMEFNVQIVEIEMNDGGTLGLDWDAWKGLVSGAITYSNNRGSSKNSGTAMAQDRNNSWQYSGNRADPTTGAARNWLLGKNWGYAEAMSVTSGEGWGAVLSIDAVAASHFVNYMVGAGKGNVLTETKAVVRTGQTADIAATLRIPYYVYTGAVSNPATGSFTDGSAINYRVRVENEGVGGNTVPVPGITGPATTVNKPGAANNIVGENTVVNDNVALPNAVPGQLLQTKVAHEGVILQVQPIIGMDSAIVRITMEVHSLTGWSRLDTPIINSRRVDSRINVKNQGLFSFGGLTKVNNVDEESKIPLLGDIPFLGLLFKQETKTTRKSFVVAFVLPQFRTEQVPADPADLALLSDVEQSRDRAIVYGK